MKKAKIMLLSIALVAVVGGALAFKAKGTLKYCYTFATQPGGSGTPFVCPAAPQACVYGTFTDVNIQVPTTICTTPTGGNIDCDVDDCPNKKVVQVDL